MSADGKDSLMLAMTRPPVFAGIPMGAFASVLSAGMLVFAATNNFLWGIAVAVPFYLLGLWLRTRFKQSIFATNRRYWGGNSFSPTAIHLAKREGFGRVETAE
jgi:type IV secretion system protein VirB3